MNFLIFLYALLLGSFYNVVGLRVPVHQSIVSPRSACPGCGRTLSVMELIPVFSYLIQLGKCRHCKKRISPIYPMMELLTASLFLFAYMKLGWTFDLLIAWTLISLLVIISVSDITYMLIPDKILLVFAGIFIAARVVQPLTPWWDSLLGGIVIFAILLGIAVITKGGIGGGDIKLYALLGVLLGFKVVLLSFFLANIFGAIIGLTGMAIGIFERKKPIPFGPFIAIGALIAYFYHQSLFAWYGSFFNF
ncbi:prepilin peptidase [Pseudogracilibacillus auburnensis]|uniref:prepilin peptidase n=1 Tax=Pseudogracilibacillus auburnensis TaxID=1494959 RepID=UPI001A972A0E|nr:A24 family peptidase [Pseudogracilibacillus auburnensis]MBO1005597.1 prepilin peptidase [Pseudogracilibacillus auburnensis]